jgi:hypothetical protein
VLVATPLAPALAVVFFRLDRDRGRTDCAFEVSLGASSSVEKVDDPPPERGDE